MVGGLPMAGGLPVPGGLPVVGGLWASGVTAGSGHVAMCDWLPSYCDSLYHRPTAHLDTGGRGLGLVDGERLREGQARGCSHWVENASHVGGRGMSEGGRHGMGIKTHVKHC